MTLDDYTEALSYDVAFWLAGVRDPGYPIEELGKLSLEVGEKLRAIAIIVLLSDADPNPFYHNLLRSAWARERFLRRCVTEGRKDLRHYVAGRVDPLLDATCAGDAALAARIDQAGPVDFREGGYEYEDDFCFAKLLSAFASGRPDAKVASGLLDRFDAYVEGADNARLAVCRALLSGDADAFDEAFEGRLDEREQEIAANKKRGELEEPPVLATRRVFVEGLALLRLATLRGIATRADYRMCPSLARAPMTRPFPGE